MILYKLPKRIADLVLEAPWGINSPFESDYRSLNDMMDTIDEEFDYPFIDWEHDKNISDKEFEELESVDPMAIAFYANESTRHLVEVTEWEDD